jgi:hypothetical protein
MTSYILNHDKINNKTFESSFEYGNFLFLLRNYKQAVRTYQLSIDERLEKQKELKKIQNILGESSQHYDKILFKSFRNILVIYAKILRDPKRAIKLFNKYNINTLQAIVVNYVTACLCGSLLYDGQIRPSEIVKTDWF